MHKLVELAVGFVPAQQAGRQGGAPQHALAVEVEVGDAAVRRSDALAAGPVALAVPEDDARFGAYPQRAVAVELQRAHDVDAGVRHGGRIDLVVLEALGAGRQVVQPARPGGDPDAALGVQCQTVQVVAGQAGRIGVVMRVELELAGIRIEVLQAAPTADPHAVLAVGNDVLDDAVVLRRLGRREQAEVIGLGIEARQAILRAGPDAALPVLEDGGDAVVRQAARIAGAVAVLDRLVAVVAVQAVGMGADPDKTLAVLHQRQHRRLVAAQRPQFLEAQRRRRRGQRVGHGGARQQQGRRQRGAGQHSEQGIGVVTAWGWGRREHVHVGVSDEERGVSGLYRASLYM